MAVEYNPNSHFFTASGGITQNQTSTQAFGPASADIFRLTSRVTVSAAKVFAICKGVVLVQPQTGSSTKVNVILRPYEQPIKGLNIKYFVYRGLSRASFFSGNNVIAPTASTSDFINKINTDFNSFYTNTGQTKPTFLAKFIGFDSANQPASLLLDDFFFKDSIYVESGGQFVENTAMAFELPIIEKGKSLGTFLAGEIGIDIVLNYGDYRLPSSNDGFVFDLNYARATQATIQLTAGMSEYEKKLKREQVFQFLDAAAYYGFHAGAGGTVEVNNAGIKEQKQGVAIYDEVINRFNTKNRLYLYIQSDRTRSYNFYGNYKISDVNTKSLKIGPTVATLVEADYANNGWPLIINNAAQTHSNAVNTLFLQFVTDNNVNTMLYGQVAQIDDSQKDNFCDANFLMLPETQPGVPSRFTKAISVSYPNVALNNTKVNIATFNILLYQGVTYSFIAGEETDENNVTTNILAQPNFFDDVFDQLNAEPLLQAKVASDFSILTSQKAKMINHYYDQSQKGISIVQTAIINDVIATEDVLTPELKRVTYVTEAVDTLNTAISLSGAITSDTKSKPSVAGLTTENQTYTLPDPFYYTLKPFTDSSETINGLELKASDKTIPSKIILGITKEENDLLVGLIGTNNLVNARLFLIDLFEDGNQLISAENILYQKYKAGIVGELSTGELKLFMPSEELLIYSLDRRYHFSRDYSNDIRGEIDLELILDLDISI